MNFPNFSHHLPINLTIRMRQAKLWLLRLLKTHYSPEVSVGWSGNIFISSAGSAEGSRESSERWDEVMRGHVEQLSVTTNQRPPLWMESRETNGNKKMKHKHKVHHFRAFCGISDLHRHSVIIKRERHFKNTFIKHYIVVVTWSFFRNSSKFVYTVSLY